MMKVVGDHAPARGLPVKHPLMHRTRTVDYAVILAGEIDMMLDDTVVHVKAGDVVIQQATNHAWINRGTQPCRVLFVLNRTISNRRQSSGTPTTTMRMAAKGRLTYLLAAIMPLVPSRHRAAAPRLGRKGIIRTSGYFGADQNPLKCNLHFGSKRSASSLAPRRRVLNQSTPRHPGLMWLRGLDVKFRSVPRPVRWTHLL